MITKGQIQVCNRLKAEGSSFVDLHSSIFGLYLKYFYSPESFAIGGALPPLLPLATRLVATVF